jgi:hypothetical protein
MAHLSTRNRNPELESIGSDLVKRLGGVWKGSGGMCLCPAHADRSPSLSVRVGDHALLFHCFSGCDNRDVIRAILRIDENALSSFNRTNDGGGWLPEPFWRRRLALNLWDHSSPLSGTPAEFYLRRRSLAILPAALRFNRRTPLGGGHDVTFRPAMIAAVHEAGRFVAVQRTFFDPDQPRRARDLLNPRLALGRPGGGAVMLAQANDRLGLAEGTETAMSAMMLFDIPVWATLGSERLHRILIPDTVTRLTLFPDNDIAGEIGVALAEQAYAMPGRRIDIEWPPVGYKDWNDVLREGGKGVGEWWRRVA